MTRKNESREPEPRFVEVRFAVPGLPGSQVEIYDRTRVNDLACWFANTAPPYMQIDVRNLPDRGMIEGEAAFDKLDSDMIAARDLGKQMRKKVAG
jgi:hypothetical protein